MSSGEKPPAIEQVRDQIRLAFPAIPFYGLVTVCDCDECKDIQKELREKRWDEVSPAFIALTRSPTLLEPESFHAFLPAYLLCALDDLTKDGVTLEFTVYSLCPDWREDGQHEPPPRADKVERLLQRARFMNPAQIQAIRTFLQFVEENAGDRDWFRPFIAQALERVWW